MKTIEIFGENYSGSWNRSRTACRGIVLREGKLLLSHETGSGLWMIPGGGLEPGEDEAACCVREVLEETGLLIRVSERALVIEEYVYDLKHVNNYFLGTVAGREEQHLTEREAKAGMEPRWLSVEEAKAVFTVLPENAHPMLKSLYGREHAALCALFGGDA